MSRPNRFLKFATDRVTLVKADGARFENIQTRVNPTKMTIWDVALPIEEGDLFERPLPNGMTEQYLITECNFSSGKEGFLAPHFDVQVRKTGAIKIKQGPTNIHNYQNVQQVQHGEGTMTTFDQRGQHVNYQYNAAGDINFGNVQNNLDLAGELEKVKAEIVKAREANLIDEDAAMDSEYQVNKAIAQAKKPEPDKRTLLEHLNQAKTVLEAFATVGGIVEGLSKAAEIAGNLMGGS